MTSISFDEVYSRFFTKVEAYDLIVDERCNSDDEIIAELMCNWLHSALVYPHIQKLFSSLTVDDDNGEIEYEISYKVNTFADREFMLDLLSYGMVYGWVQPKVKSITGIVQTFGTQDEKFFSQSQHLSELRALQDDTEKKIRDMTSSRSFMNNDYLDGNAAYAKKRNKT